jgi:hypothetical protein
MIRATSTPDSSVQGGLRTVTVLDVGHSHDEGAA